MPHNATTFVGTNIELEKLHALVCKPDNALSILLASKAVDWRYLQRRQFNFGGLWKAGVKAFKYHLNRILGSCGVTFEEFWTLITELKGILNSRQIVHLSSVPNEFKVLTPTHF